MTSPRTTNGFSTDRDKGKRTFASDTMGEPHLGGARLHQVRPWFLQQKSTTPSLKLTTKAPEDRPKPKRKGICLPLPPFFRGFRCCCFREGTAPNKNQIHPQSLTANAPEKWWLEDSFPTGKVTFQGQTRCSTSGG